MSKNIVVCLDGTSNEFCTNNTNVVRLYQALVHDPARQTTYYHPGLGTMEAVGAMTSLTRRFTKLLGLAFGYGLEADIARAYAFIMRTYVSGDRIYLFGFSRGAYTARAVAALIHMYGLMRPENEGLIVYALRMLSAVHRREGRADDIFEVANAFKLTFSGNPVGIHFVGVWDTVSSVGWIANPLRLPFTASNPSVLVSRHAVSIDERRAFFRQNLWSVDAPGDVTQVLFPGDHCDVGGGHPGDDRAAKVALRWMVNEASQHGLLLDQAGTALLDDGGQEASAAAADLHRSLRGWWLLAEFMPKMHYDWKTRRRSPRPNLFRRRRMPDGSRVHCSAWDRGEAYRKRLPPGAVRES